MYTPYDTNDPRPLFEAMAAVEHLAEICERERSVAWAHLEPDWFEDNDDDTE